jgi:lysyl-tRNA synthetase class 2
VLIPAPIPEPHIDAPAAENGCLQTSPEICMKQLLAAGFEKVFQISRCFRRRERGSRHLPEFSLLEWYGAGESYTDLMQTCEELFGTLLRALSLPWKITRLGGEIDLSPSWDRLSVADAFERYGDESMHGALSGGRFDQVMAINIEPRIGKARPVFLYDYPAAVSPLAAPKIEDPGVAQRFELYIAGLELANGCTELTDPAMQRQRFEAEIARRKWEGLPSYPLPTAFLEALEAMPAAAGCALGIDRLVMLFTDSRAIDEVVAFPPENLI